MVRSVVEVSILVEFSRRIDEVLEAIKGLESIVYALK